MKIIKLAIILLLAGVVLSFVKSGRDFSIVKALPFADGEPVNIYHGAALMILLVTCWGYYRWTQNNEEDE